MWSMSVRCVASHPFSVVRLGPISGCGTARPGASTILGVQHDSLSCRGQPFAVIEGQRFAVVEDAPGSGEHGRPSGRDRASAAGFHLPVNPRPAPAARSFSVVVTMIVAGSPLC